LIECQPEAGKLDCLDERSDKDTKLQGNKEGKMERWNNGKNE
jgi:hypothetical protein